VSGTDLGQFLQAAHRQLTQAERAAPPADTRLDEIAGQLGRLVGVLPRYLALTSASATGKPWSRQAGDMTSALGTAAASLSRWTQHASRPREWTSDYAGMVAAAADSLDAGYELLRTHLDASSGGLIAGRSWWAPVICSPQVATAIFDEVTALAQLTAGHARYVATHAEDETATALEGAGIWLVRAADAGRAARWHTTSRAEHTLMYAIPAAAFPSRTAPRDRESESALCAGILGSTERLRHTAWRSVAGEPPDGGADAWHYTASAARIACHLASVILRSTPDEHTGALTVAAATAARASAIWRDVSTAWTRFRTDTLPATTAVMTDASDLILRLGRLAYADPGWTPASGTSVSPRHPERARAVLAVVHHTADTLTRIAAGDLAAIADTVNAGRLYALNDAASRAATGRYVKIGGQDAEILHEAYLTAFDASSRLAGHLDQIAISRATPSLTLTKMRAAALIPRDVIWHHHHEPELVAPTPLDRFQAQMRQLGICDPGLLEQARQLDRAAEARLRRAALDAALSTRAPRQPDHRHGTSRGG
jgi:hypothetical protein